MHGLENSVVVKSRSESTLCNTRIVRGVLRVYFGLFDAIIGVNCTSSTEALLKIGREAYIPAQSGLAFASFGTTFAAFVRACSPDCMPHCETQPLGGCFAIHHGRFVGLHCCADCQTPKPACVLGLGVEGAAEVPSTPDPRSAVAKSVDLPVLNLLKFLNSGCVPLLAPAQSISLFGLVPLARFMANAILFALPSHHDRASTRSHVSQPLVGSSRAVATCHYSSRRL